MKDQYDLYMKDDSTFLYVNGLNCLFDQGNVPEVYQRFQKNGKTVLSISDSVQKHLYAIKSELLKSYGTKDLMLPDNQPVVYLDIAIGDIKGVCVEDRISFFSLYYQDSKGKFFELQVDKAKHLIALEGFLTSVDTIEFILSILITINLNDCELSGKRYYTDFINQYDLTSSTLTNKAKTKIVKKARKKFNCFEVFKKPKSVSGWKNKRHIVKSFTRVYHSGKKVEIKSYSRGMAKCA